MNFCATTPKGGAAQDGRRAPNGSRQRPAHSFTYTETSVTEDSPGHPSLRIPHTLGKVVSSWKVDRSDLDPHRQERPIEAADVLPHSTKAYADPGDRVAATRCTMVNHRDRIPLWGRPEDEMCNFYIMYWWCPVPWTRARSSLRARLYGPWGGSG